MPKPNPNEEKPEYLKRCTAEVVGEGMAPDQAFAVCNRYWDDAKKQRSALSLHAPVELALGESGESTNEFAVTAYTGQIVELGFWGRYVFDLAGMKYSQKMPILREHARDRVVGYSTKTWVDGANLLLTGKFSTRTLDGQEIRELAKEGFPWQASIGIWPKKVKILDTDKETATVNGQIVTGPLEIWLESKVKEVSICALGADDQTAAIGLNLAEVEKAPVSIERAEISQEVEAMPMTLAMLEAEAPALLEEIRASAHDGGFQAGREVGVSEERQRVLKILEANGDRELTLAGIADGSQAVDVAVRISLAKDDFRAKALADMQREAPESLGQGNPGRTEGDFESRVAELQAQGKAVNRAAAIKLAARQYPELHQAYIDRHNPA